MTAYFTIRWVVGVVRILDQRLLPLQTVYVDYTNYREVAEAIKDMVIRGAPALGAAARYGDASDVRALRAELNTAADVIRQARPTAANLFWAADRVLRRAADSTLATPDDLRAAVLDEAHNIADEDAQSNRQMGLNALTLIPDQATVIHH